MAESLREIAISGLGSVLDKAGARYPIFNKEWSTEGQFKGGSNYAITAQNSISTNNLNGDTTSGTINWLFPGESIYDGVTFEIDYGAFTEDDPADEIDWDIPIERVEIFHGDNKLMTLYYRDFVNSFKMGDSESRITHRLNRCFQDTLVGSQAKFTQTINILGIKNYGFSENASKGHQTIPTPGIEKLKVRITMRNQFTIVDGGLTTPARPLITDCRVFASHRSYRTESLYQRDIGALVGKRQPISVYDSVDCGSVAFTTDASGNKSSLTLRLESVESNYVSFLTLRLRPATQTNKDSMNATPFDFIQETNYIKFNGAEFKQLYTSSFNRETFRRNHRGRTPKSGYATKAVKDGEIIILSSEASVFELEDICPDYYYPSCGPQLILGNVIGLTPATNYVLDVYAVLMKAIMSGN